MQTFNSGLKSKEIQSSKVDLHVSTLKLTSSSNEVELLLLITIILTRVTGNSVQFVIICHIGCSMNFY